MVTTAKQDRFSSASSSFQLRKDERSIKRRDTENAEAQSVSRSAFAMAAVKTFSLLISYTSQIKPQ